MKKPIIYSFILLAFVLIHPMQSNSQSLLDKIKTELRKTGDAITRNINPKENNASDTADGAKEKNASKAGKSGASVDMAKQKQKFLKACKRDDRATAKKIDCSCASKKYSKIVSARIRDLDKKIANQKKPEDVKFHKEQKANFMQESTSPRSFQYRDILDQSMKGCPAKAGQ